MTSERVFTIVGAVAAVILQIVVAPYIAVFAAVPNFAIAFSIALAVVCARTFSPIVPFALGLVFDLASGGPVGALAFSLTLLSYLLARYVDHAGNDSLVMSIVFIALGVLLVELVYGFMLSMLGSAGDFVQALAYRMAPCFVYDTILALLVYPLARRFAQPKPATRGDIVQLR